MVCSRCEVRKKRVIATTGKEGSYCRKCGIEVSRIWYDENTKYKIKKTMDYLKKTNYAREKTPIERKIRYIKRVTRKKYPLKNQKCFYCKNLAEVRHHTTSPITIHSFIFLCKKHHKEIHRKMLEGGKEK